MSSAVPVMNSSAEAKGWASRTFIQGDCPAHVVRIHLLTAEAFSVWIGERPQRIRTIAEQSRFDLEPGGLLPIHDEQGRLTDVILIVGSTASLWDIASLPAHLPGLAFAIVGEHSRSLIKKMVLGWALGSYRFDCYYTQDRLRQALVPRLVLPDDEGINDIVRVGWAVTFVRDLGNTPSNDMGPHELQLLASSLASRFDGSLRIVEGDQLVAENYPLIHAVGRASVRPPCLIDLKFGSESAPRITLVGKGVCFDSGGLHLKSFEQMKDMKQDMAGAAHAFALASLILDAHLPVRLRVLVPAVDNVISGGAYRLQDILRSRKGLTIEVGSTDNEGRLILADALTDADSESPNLLVDFSTVTLFEAGGGIIGAFYTANDRIAEELARLSEECEDPIWRMPLSGALLHRIRGRLADLTNTGTILSASSVRAALFLQQFVQPTTDWIHFDLPEGNLEDRPGRPYGGEAYGLRAAYEFIKERYHA